MFERMFLAVQAVLSHGNLTQNANRVSGADVIAALGKCDPLGAALYRIYATQDAGAWRAAVNLLTERVLPKREVSEEAYRRVAGAALQEYIGCACEHCNGTGIRLDDRGVRRTCGACHGTGRASADHRSRARLLGLRADQYQPLASVFDDCKDALHRAEYAAGAMMSYQLGRRKYPPRVLEPGCS